MLLLVEVTTARAPQPHLFSVSYCKRGAQIGEGCLLMAAQVRSLWSPAKSGRVCMCKFGTHTLAVSMSLAEIGGHSPIAPAQRAIVRRMKRIGQCYICGGSGPDTRDHVIPDCFFVEPRPKNLLTFPAHSACNARLSLSDEYARNILAGLGSEKSTVAQKLWEGKIDRSIKGNRALRSHIAAALIPKADKYSAGGIYLGSAPGIRIDTKRFYPTMEKIVRGVHRLCAGSPMPSDARFRWFLQEPVHGRRRQFFDASRPSLSYLGVFDSRFTLVNGDDAGSVVGTVWWLRFYDTVPIECVTTFSPVYPPAPKSRSAVTA